MDNTTSSTLIINNFDLQTILNFNIYVFVNIFIYFVAATLGIMIAIKIVKGIAGFVYYTWTSRYERRAKEIEELNRKTHDRLVEIEEAISMHKKIGEIVRTITRLRYYASRLEKYDKTIHGDVDNLIDILQSDYNKENESISVKEIDKSKEIIEKIRKKVDKLWFKKG